MCVSMDLIFFSSSIRLFLTSTLDNNAANSVAARDRVLDLAASSSYKLALECIDSCTRLHEQCPKPSPQMLPDRVIDCSNPDRPYIVLTGLDGNLRQGKYITLSYIWGGPQPFMSTTQNILTYATHGLEILKFPKTIREAIVATHGLGIRYLWIDALCILQDSDEDKRRQIGMMAMIYRNSFATIIVACGNDVNEGFLYRDRPRKVPDARIPYRCPDGRVGSVWIAIASDTSSGDATRTYYDEMEPVNYRGWCLQERLLSPRSFIYASHTLQYYCQTETVNIGQALCEPSTAMRLPNTVFWPSPRDQSPSIVSTSDQITARRAWLSVIWDYTNRNITVPEDKLVALAGIAEIFHHVYNSEYLAGLWRKTLLLDLLWNTRNSSELQPRLTKYRAPSWSWASIDGLVLSQNFEEKLKPGSYYIVECEILECEVTLGSENMPFGQVLAGTLSLKSHLKEARLEYNSGGISGHVFVHLDSETEPVKIGWAHMDAAEQLIDDIWIIPLMWDRDGVFVEGLVMAAAAAAPLGDCYFRRVGHFTNLYGSRDIRWIENAPKQTITLV